jgi:hypothetical protein
MVSAWVPLAAFQQRTLPFVCVKTGKLADGWVLVQALWTPPWTRWLLLFTPVPFQATYWILRIEVKGWLPMSARAAGRLRRVRYAAMAGLATGAVLLAGALCTGWTVLTWLALAAVAGAIMAGLLESLCSVGAYLDRSTGQVLLRRVHPAFRAAVRRQVSQSSLGRRDWGDGAHT